MRDQVGFFYQIVGIEGGRPEESKGERGVGQQVSNG